MQSNNDRITDTLIDFAKILVVIILSVSLARILFKLEYGLHKKPTQDTTKHTVR